MRTGIKGAETTAGATSGGSNGQNTLKNASTATKSSTRGFSGAAKTMVPLSWGIGATLWYRGTMVPVPWYQTPLLRLLLCEP